MQESDLGTVWRRRLTRRGFVRGATAGAAAVGVTSLAACAQPVAVPAAPTTAPAAAAPTTAAATATPQAKQGGKFTISFQGEAPNLDPHMVSQIGAHVFGPGIAYSKLLAYRTDVPPTERLPGPDLAESWEQPDDVTYIFKIRKNAKFQNVAPVNGRPVVAEDVRYSFQRQLDLKVTSGSLPQIAKMEVVDPNTFKITAPKPDADFLVSIPNSTNKVIPKESVDLKGDLKEGPVIGSGAWINVDYQKDKVATLRKNPDYYFPGFPRVDTIDIVRILDPATLFAGFRGKQVDVITGTVLTFKDVETIQKTSPDIVFESFKSPIGVDMHVNASKAPYSDKRVRQAIFKAIDKQAIIDTVFGGQAWFWAGVRMPQDDFYLPEAEIKALYKQDLNAAKQLLTQANIANFPEVEIFVLGFGTTYKDSAELVQADLAKIGIKARLKVSEANVQWANAVQLGEQGGYDIAVGASLPISANSDLYTAYHSSAPRYVGKIKDPAFDAMIDKQATLVKDPNERRKILQDIQRYVVDQAQNLYLVGLMSPNLRWKYVKDYFIQPNVEESFIRVWLDK
jgi:peptide/nickel transport system substrate-binding protein